MDTQLRDLPPLKRYRLMQRDLELANQLQNQSEVKPLQLPAKKRKQTRIDYEEDESSNPTYLSLPAKKRIWAIDPDLLSGNPLSPFDLNVEYKPYVDDKGIEKNGTVLVESSLVVEDDDNDNKENIDPLWKETGLDLCDAELEDKEVAEAEEDDDKENIDSLWKETDLDLFDSKLEDSEVEKLEEEEEDGIMCVVCQSTDGEPSNPIVFCDGCDLMVHASCYGNPLVKAIPEGDWFCELCIGSKENREKDLSCCLCTTKGGAMKATKDGRWAHITCSLFVPEVYFEDPEGREGICCSEILSKRWKDRCYLCKIRRGCVIECSEMKCGLGFHVTCGLKEDLCIEYREGKKSGGIVVGFCSEHTKLWERQQESGKYKIVARGEDRK